ncbi:PAS domain S-box protein [Methanosarcina siciliae]
MPEKNMRYGSIDQKSQGGEELYRMIFDHSMDGIILADPGDYGKILSANPAACRMLGWTEEELVGKECDAISDLQEPTLSALLDERTHSGSARAQLTYRRKDGTTFPGEVSMTFFTDSNGEPRTVAIIRDITDRKQAEGVLLESENRYKAIFDNSLDGIFVTIPDGTILAANPAACQMFGMTEEELISAGRNGTVDTSDPRLNSVLDERARTGRFKGELNHRRKDGTIFPSEISSILFKDENGLTKGVMVIRDISERKKAEKTLQESEERFRSAFDDSAVAMALVDPDARISRVNDAFCQMLGFEKSEIEGRTFLDFTYPDDIEPSLLAHKAVITGEKPFLWIEKRYIRKDGQVIWCDVSSSPVLDSKGCPIYTVAHIQDITERKRAEDTLAFERSQLLSIFDGMDDAVYVADPYTYEVLYANKAMKERLGVEFVGGSCYREFQRRSSPCDFCTNPMILKERDKPYQWEYYNPTVNRYFMIMDRIIKWPDGRDVRFEIAKDITARKKAEEALRESEAKYRNLFETVQEALYIEQLIYDEPGNVVDWIFEDFNPAGFELLGLKDIGEAKGKRGSEVLGCEVASFYLPMIEMARQSSKAVTFQYRSPYVDKQFLTSYIVRGDRLVSTHVDITELKKIEAALRESEERLRLLGDNLPDSAVYQYAHEPDGSVRFLYFSAGIEKLNGIKVSDVLRDPSTLHRQIPPDYFERLVEAEARSVSELSDFNMETPMHLPDGQVKWMRLHSRPRRLPDGRTIWDGVQTDVTELKRAEEQLHETELSCKVAEAVESERQRLFDVLETLPVMICLLTSDHHIAFANRSFREKFGESGGRHCYEHCFGSTLPCEFCESYQVLETGQPHNWEVTTPDGSVIDIYSFPFTDVDGSPMILKMDIDITERKQAEEKLRDSEEKYRNIVETANEIILITDKESAITYVNKKMVDMLGYTLEEFIGRPIWSFISEECKPVVKMKLEKRVQGISESYELKLIRKDGSSLWTFLNAKPLFDKEGKYMGAMSMLTDITKRKEAEEALSIIETARKKEIHHRIKNNLQVISSLLDLQAEQFRDRDNIKDSEVLEAFRESQDRVVSMALIHEELYKGDGFETLNFSPYIKELVENLFQTYRLGDIDISLNIDLEENVFFDMDTAVPLGMIVNELVSNSLKHAFIGRDKGEIRIELHREEFTELESENCKSTNFTLTVSDNGVGIPDNLDIEDLGSLGMQLVVSLIDQMNGELEMKRNNGTEFTMKFTVTEKDNLAQVGLKSQENG